MKLRVLAAAALVPILLLTVLVAPKIMMAILVGVVCAIAAYELLYGTGLVRHVRLISYAAVMAFLVVMWCYLGMEPLCAQLGILIYVILLFAEILISNGKLRFDRIAICLVAGVVFPYLLSALVRIMGGENGRMLILIPFIQAFLADTGAYFVGCAWGKHKLAPVISPNKSVEGVFGGIIFAIVGMLIYSLILDFGFQKSVSYASAVIYGVVGALSGVFGDLCFSAIKRQTGIKDYGNLIPGHGGALDRFDSLIVVAPLAEILLVLLPIME